MDLDEFLRLNGADVDLVLAGARTIVELGPDDRLIAVGSLAEGLGNRKSDVDLLLLTSRIEHRGASPDEVRSFTAGRSLVDLRVVPEAAETGLRERLAAWAEAGWNLMVAADFTPSEMLLLHRLGAGRRLWPAGASSRSGDEVLTTQVGRLKLHIARHMARTIQVDMAGYREEGDAALLVYAAQDLLGHAADGLLAGSGFTNPTPKWRSRLLDRLPMDWEQSLQLPVSGLRPSEVYWRLHRAPAVATLDAALAHASRIAAFARAVFHWAEEGLVHGAPAPRRLGRSSGPSSVSPPVLDIDVDFHRVDQGVMIGRLNDFGQTLEMSVAQFAGLLWLDNGGDLADRAGQATSNENLVLDGALAGLVDQARQAGLQLPGLEPDGESAGGFGARHALKV
ncbi:nucleotidyltransferase domain-containing protein [Caulobacter sp. BE254]|uniref:nucleotidyltransferase domain-containing protein n=1 Tax=Caulobacter sp. BE254 TaxID=2817720 RepID=UPI002857EB41|nr:nucleotidyltransferase domain-containing protein [Caulobacter sp. BE254]MDR7116636.1 hypothetical protein [Caulobacter sp. BE254]